MTMYMYIFYCSVLLVADLPWLKVEEKDAKFHWTENLLPDFILPGQCSPQTRFKCMLLAFPITKAQFQMPNFGYIKVRIGYCTLCTVMVFQNFQGAQESIPPAKIACWHGGPVRQPYSYLVSSPYRCSKIKHRSWWYLFLDILCKKNKFKIVRLKLWDNSRAERAGNTRG